MYTENGIEIDVNRNIPMKDLVIEGQRTKIAELEGAVETLKRLLANAHDHADALHRQACDKIEIQVTNSWKVAVVNAWMAQGIRPMHEDPVKAVSELIKGAIDEHRWQVHLTDAQATTYESKKVNGIPDKE